MIRLKVLMIRNSCARRKLRARNKARAKLLFSGLAALLAWVPLAVSSDQLALGKDLAMRRDKGNCLACHAIADGELPGNIGPPLIAMKARFPEPEVLRKQIWDATVRNPDSRMPPFGRHGILSSEEIDLIVDYLYTL